MWAHVVQCFSMTTVIAKSFKILRKLAATTRKCIRILNEYVNFWRTAQFLKIEPFRLHDLHILNVGGEGNWGHVWCVLCVWIKHIALYHVPFGIQHSAEGLDLILLMDAPSYAFHIRYPMSKYWVFGLYTYYCVHSKLHLLRIGRLFFSLIFVFNFNENDLIWEIFSLKCHPYYRLLKRNHRIPALDYAWAMITFYLYLSFFLFTFFFSFSLAISFVILQFVQKKRIGNGIGMCLLPHRAQTKINRTKILCWCQLLTTDYSLAIAALFPKLNIRRKKTDKNAIK